MPDSEPDNPAPPTVSATALRWLVTAQALFGIALTLLLLAGSVALFGYAVGMTGGVVWNQHPLLAGARLALAIPALAVCAVLLRALRAPLPEPEGIPLDRSEAPEFYALLDRFRIRFDIRQPLRVRVTGEMNAAIVARPGALILQVGLPLLVSVTPKQWAAVVAHEFGHLRMQRRGPGAWSAHLRAWWHRVLERIDHDRSAVGRSLAWLMKTADHRYLSDALRLSRAEEFEADAWAARSIGAESLAGALFAVAIKDRFLQDDYWRKVHAQADHRHEPVILPFRQMASALKAGFDPAEATAAYSDDIDEAEARDETTLTHPTVAARCAKLAVAPRHPAGQAAPAAEVYLQPVLHRLALELDQGWWAANGGEWSARHREVQRAHRRIARLEQQAARLGSAERLELAVLVERYGGERDPLEFYLALVAAEPVAAEALLATGRLLVERGEREGIGYLLRASINDSEIGLAATAHILAFAQGHEIDWLAQRAIWRAARLLSLGQAVRREAAEDPAGGAWQAPNLDALMLRRLGRELSAYPQVRRAYLVRRISAQAPQWRAHVLVLRSDEQGAAFAGQVAQLAEAIVPEESPVQVLAVGRGSKWEHQAKAIRGSMIRLKRPASPAPG